MKRWFSAYTWGLVFGAGLLVAGMTRPERVLGFLDLGGDWDPSLALVMAGGIGVHALAYRWMPRLGRPLWADVFAVPTRRDVDGRLLLGAALFGAGWGLAGYCPGPGLVAAAGGQGSALAFAAAMFAGMWAFATWEIARAGQPKAVPTATPNPPLREAS